MIVLHKNLSNESICNYKLSPIDYRCLLYNYPLISCFLYFQFLFQWINYRQNLIFDNYFLWFFVFWQSLEIISAFPMCLQSFSTECHKPSSVKWRLWKILRQYSKLLSYNTFQHKETQTSMLQVLKFFQFIFNQAITELFP